MTTFFHGWHAKTVWEAVEAIGTVGVAILAIWGKGIRAVLSPPKLEIQPHNNLRGQFAKLVHGQMVANSGGPIPSFYYHLRVKNLRPWLVAHDCRVLLVGLERRGPNNQFQEIVFPVPLQFVWAPELANESLVTITKVRIFDFGRVIKGRGDFEPRLKTYPTNFDGHVRKGEAVRYHLEIDAANYASPRATIFEVAWDGEWADTSEDMVRHLTIAEIKQ